MLRQREDANINTVTATIERPQISFQRRQNERAIAGVAGGIADQLGLPAGYVRAAFITLTAIWGLGIALYVILWMVAFDETSDEAIEPLDRSRVLGAASVFAGGMLVLRGFGLWPVDGLVVVAAALSFGVSLLGNYDWVARILDPDRKRQSPLQLIGGVLFLLVGLGVLAWAVAQIPTMGSVATAVLITSMGIALVFGPWLVSFGRQLGDERRERIRQEERSEMAAHLHDSVLQTLALMQRTDDPKRIATLARQQERELRSWLYGASAGTSADGISDALQHAASRLERDFALPVEVVTVGEMEMDDHVRSVVAAASEAMTNAAKHSGADEISVYAEATEGRMDVWVTDFGKGFDMDEIADDRHGIRSSIRQRMERIGGGSSVESVVGEGTEVHLWMNRNGRVES